MNKPLISVCIAQYNRSEFIEHCVDSILSQEYENFEVIFIDDGSTDPRVAEIAESYKDSRFCFTRQENVGFTRSIRRAIEKSRGEFVAIQGAGDISHPLRLVQQLELLIAEPSMAAVGCFVETEEVNRNGNKSSKGKLYRPSPPTLEGMLAGNHGFTHGEVMFRRSAYDRVGGYREVFRYAQDRDLWIRMLEHYSMGVVENALYVKRRFQTDGVSTNSVNVLLQKHYSQLARQSHYLRKAYGTDLVDDLKNESLFFIERSYSLRFEAAKILSKCLIENDHKSKKSIIKYINCSENMLGKAFVFFTSYIIYMLRLVKH